MYKFNVLLLDHFIIRFGRRKPLSLYLMIGSVMGISAGVLSDRAGEGVNF